jgi:hypothetical protein
MLKVTSQLNEIFNNKCVAFASDPAMMEKLRAGSFYAKQMALGRSELDAICNAVSGSM